MKVKSESEVTQSYLNLSDPHGLQPSRLLCSWDFTGKSTGVGWHCLLWNEDLALPKLKEKNKFSQRNQWGLRESKTCKMMKPIWVWYHASHGEGSYSLVSQGTWHISCASNMSQPKDMELDFTLPLVHPSHPSTNTKMVSPNPCIRFSKDKSKVTLEAKNQSSGKCNLRKYLDFCTHSGISSIISGILWV